MCQLEQGNWGSSNPMKAPHSLYLQRVQALILVIGHVRWSTFIHTPQAGHMRLGAPVGELARGLWQET